MFSPAYALASKPISGRSGAVFPGMKRNQAQNIISSVRHVQEDEKRKEGKRLDFSTVKMYLHFLR